MAGPLVAAAVLFDRVYPALEVNDSKQVSARRRETLCQEIIASALAWGVGVVETAEMSSCSMHQATFLAMRRAVGAMRRDPPVLLVDGIWVIPGTFPFPQEAIIGGDAKSASIAAASILAKVTRDRRMGELDVVYPGYGFARHKGYCTPEHQQALLRLGPSPEHRTRFAPVRACHEQLSLLEAQRRTR